MRLLPSLFALILTGTAVGEAFPNPVGSSSSITHFGVVQDKRPLSFAQIEQLIANRTPDEIIASEILERGVSFGIDRVVIDGLRAKGAGKKTLEALQGKQGKSATESVLPEPDKVIILVAEFTSLDGQKHGVSESILDQLRDATNEYPEIEIQSLTEPVTAQQGSAVARLRGKERGASIVLWGWYSSSKDKVLMSVHFEVVESPAALALMAEKETFVRPIAELEGFQIQTRLSSEMTYLTLLTIGLARLEGLDFDGAISRFTKALIQPSIPDTMVNKTDVLFYRSFAYFMKSLFSLSGEFPKTIEDLNEVIRLEPDKGVAYLLRAGAYAMSDNFDKAIQDCNRVVEIDPDNSAAYMLRGALFDQKKDSARASSDFEKGARLIEAETGTDPQDPSGHYNRGHAYHLKGDELRALASLTKGLELNPQDPLLVLLLLQRAEVLATLKRYDDALADLSRAIKIKGSYSILYYARGGVFGEKGETDKAIIDYSQAIKMSPNIAEVYNDRGNAYRQKGDYKTALADFDQAIRLRPKYSAAYYNRALTNKDKGNLSGALIDLNKFIELEPNDPDGFSQRANVHKKKGQFSAALLDYGQAIEFSPMDPKLYFSRGDAQQRSGNLDSALADYSKAITLEKDYLAFLFRARVYQGLGKTELALNDYAESLKLEPNDTLVYFLRGDLYEQQNQLQFAINDYSAYIGLKPEDADGYLRRAKVYRRVSKLSDAIDDYTKAIGIRADSESYLLRGYANENLGKLDAALRDYSEAVRIKPTLADGYLFRGLAYARKGDRDRAVDDLKKVLEMTKDLELTGPAKKKLEELGIK